MAKISQARMDELKNAALEKIEALGEIEGVVVKTRSGFRKRLHRNVTKRSEQKTLNEALKKLTGEESNKKTCDYQIILPVLFCDENFFKRLKDAIDELPGVANNLPYLLKDALLIQYYPHIVKAIEAFLEHDDIEQLFDACFEPFKQKSKAYKQKKELLHEAQERETRSALNTLLKGQRKSGTKGRAVLLFNEHELGLDTEEGIRGMASFYGYLPRDIELMIQNFRKFHKEEEIRMKRQENSKECRMFDDLLENKALKTPWLDELMQDWSRKKLAYECGYTDEQIATIENNYQNLK